MMVPGGSRYDTEKNRVGAGWQPIIERLHSDLLELVPNYEVLQIKEKFGGLRYYIATGTGFNPDHTSRMWNLIRDAETACWAICEDCGSTRRVTTETLGYKNHWIRTLCASCRTTAYDAWCQRTGKDYLVR